MKLTQSFNLNILLTLAALFTIGASFDQTKKKLTASNCIYFEFLNTIDSKVFDVIDSAYCIAYIANDGRFRVEVGPDYYVYDGDTMYSYFWENNQVIIENPDPSDPIAAEISFVMKLDEWYDSKSMKEKNAYKLTKKKDLGGDIPDSMVIRIDDKSADIKTIEYHDINGDLNRIQIIEQVIDSTCNSSRFVPDIPDSTEKIRL